MRGWYRWDPFQLSLVSHPLRAKTSLILGRMIVRRGFNISLPGVDLQSLTVHLIYFLSTTVLITGCWIRLTLTSIFAASFLSRTFNPRSFKSLYHSLTLHGNLSSIRTSLISTLLSLKTTHWTSRCVHNYEQIQMRSMAMPRNCRR